MFLRCVSLPVRTCTIQYFELEKWGKRHSNRKAPVGAITASCTKVEVRRTLVVSLMYGNNILMFCSISNKGLLCRQLSCPISRLLKATFAAKLCKIMFLSICLLKQLNLSLHILCWHLSLVRKFWAQSLVRNALFLWYATSQFFANGPQTASKVDYRFIFPETLFRNTMCVSHHFRARSSWFL